jgi:hypothetical protein
MIEREELAIANLKFLLLCFENMPGLCINFHKSEGMVWATSPEFQQRVANMLNWKFGTFPFTYLGLPICDQVVVGSDVGGGGLGIKVGKREAPWMDMFISSAVGLILINACLSNFPMHVMGVCLLSACVHQVFDNHHS